MGWRVLARALVLLPIVLWNAAALAQTAVGSAFTYQGLLSEAGSPADGLYDLRLLLYDASVGGSQVGPIVTLDDVAVSGGLFTVTLDFGAAAFAGQARWLDLAVRPGGSSGGFVPLAGRQELRPAPQAVFSTGAPWAGVIGKPAGFADGIDDDALQSLACGAGQVAKWNGTAWTCAADANSLGTVTSVAAGTGLTGGPITTTGTLAVATAGISTPLVADGAVTTPKIANAAVTGPKIANGAVGLAQIDASQVQARVTGTCAPGLYLTGINPDGSAACALLPLPNVITTVDDPANVLDGRTSIAVAPDGLPVVSYRDATVAGLKVLKCGNAACTVVAVTTTVDDTSGQIGYDSSIAIGGDGLPIVSHADISTGNLRVVHCGNPECTSGNTVTVADGSANSVGLASSLAIGADGLAVVSYYDATVRGLRVLKCGNAVCNVGNVITVVDDPANDVGSATSIAVGGDGLPVIAYFDSTNRALKLLKCGGAACNTANAITVVDDPPGGIQSPLSLDIAPDGLPVIVYTETVGPQDRRLKIVRCGNASCDAGNVFQYLHTAAQTPSALSLAVPPDDRPIASFYASADASLWVAKCGQPACASGTLLSRVDDYATGSVGTFSSIAIGADGLPVVSYSDNVNFSIKVARCGNAACR